MLHAWMARGIDRPEKETMYPVISEYHGNMLPIRTYRIRTAGLVDR